MEGHTTFLHKIVGPRHFANRGLRVFLNVFAQ